MTKKLNTKDVFSFEEAMNLFHVGAHGFVFVNAMGGKFTSSLDQHQRVSIDSLQKEGSE